MRWAFFRTVTLLLVSSLALELEAYSQDENLDNPDQHYQLKSNNYVPGGPPETYVYKSGGDRTSTDRFKNTFGKFVIGPNMDDGKATYWWKGSGPPSNPTNQHSDTLKYLGRTTMKDTRPDVGGEADGWLYEATDASGKKWWIFFGEDKLNNIQRYPIYYSFEEPDQNKFKRWLTYSGTSRL